MKLLKADDIVTTGAFIGYPELVEEMRKLVGKPGKVVKVHLDGTVTVKHPQSTESWLWPIEVCKKESSGTLDEPVRNDELQSLVKKINKLVRTLQKDLSDLEAKINAGIIR